MRGPWRLRSGEGVFDAEPSHLDAHPGIENVIAEVLAKVDLSGPDVANPEEGLFIATIDLGRVVGFNHCVETQPGAAVLYEYRGADRTWPTRFVLGRRPTPTKLVTVVLNRADGGYTLTTAWFGPLAPREAGDPLATAADKEWWDHHALTWPGT